MRSLTLSNSVRMLLALAAASAVGKGLPAEAQEVAAAAASEVAAAPVEEIIVTGRQLSSAEEIVEERMKLDVVADIVGAEQIARVGDSSVSLALRRLPAVTVVGDQFIYVRGLGERYSSTTLNGAYVPSPDLTRNVIPLDLFPAEIVESLSIQKGYSPEQPAAFGGGSVNIRTRAIPDAPVLSVQVGTGWNSESSGNGLGYKGGDDDEWGTDDGTRELPRRITRAIGQYQGDLSAAGIYSSLLKDGQVHQFSEAQQINRELATSLYRDLNFTKQSMDPDLSLEGAAGNTWTVGETGDWKIGGLVVADYKNQWRERERVNRSVTDPDNVSNQTQRTSNIVSLTGSASAGVSYADEHSLQANVIYLRNTEDEASLTLGNNFNFQQATGDQFRNYRVRFEERELDVLQLHGQHKLGAATRELFGGLPALDRLEGMGFGWYYSEATANTDIPTEVLFSATDDVDPATGDLISTSIRSSSTAADYRYTELEDEVTSYGWNLSSMPLEIGNSQVVLSGGYDYYEKGRSYLQTQLGLGTTSAAALGSLVGTPGDVFSDANILDPAYGYTLSLGGIGTESYLAGETIDAAWGKLDWTWKETWRVMAGVRWEDFSQLSVPIDQYEFDTTIGKIPVPQDQFASLATAEDDYYPAATLTWMRDDFWAERFQLRFGWSETTARPDLREISSATFIDPLTEARVRGNPDLVSASLTNFDIRGEWYFQGGDNLTVSLFYKSIDDPIETIAAAGTDDNISLTFINADSADLYGLEVEWLKSLGWIAPGSLAESFFVSGNVTVSDSEITIGSNAVNLTSKTRRLSQHSPWVANVQVGFDAPNERHAASLAYNASGERVFFAGRGGAPDAKEQPFHSLDLVYSYYPTEALALKLRLQNLLDQDSTIEQGGVDVLEQTVGVNYKLDLSYRF